MEPWGTRSSSLGRHIEVLDRDTCLALLAATVVGRVAWSVPGGRLEVLPVNYVLDGDDLVFRTSRDDRVTTGAPMSFEVDEVEPALHAGWSVLVQGHAEIVEEPGEIRRLEELAGAPWVAFLEPVFIRLRSDDIVGRRL
ncbi:MAG TPA: pyridoxamine 5'-phosphate oxidase family protein, partial [Nonomuraea sp.]|nr:pyridoxamine 5'-phosphate oxidase family protein [Nonomuraea sp.]